jgi:hypothetical protein
MYPENIEELINSTQNLLEQIYPILQEENCNLETVDAWIRVAKALETLELQERVLPPLAETVQNGA